MAYGGENLIREEGEECVCFQVCKTGIYIRKARERLTGKI